MSTSHTPPALEIPESPGRINPALYIDRELSWLAFNRRVLEEAQDSHNPLLERLKFLAIFSTNLDEFFMTRVAGVKKQIQASVYQRAPSGYTPQEQYQAIREALMPDLAAAQRLLRDDLMPALQAAGIYILHYEELNKAQRAAMQRYYDSEVFPVLTPLAIDGNHPFPFVSNLNVNTFVIITHPIQGQLYARVKIPEVLLRLVELPPETCKGKQGEPPPRCFVWLEDIISANLANLFPGSEEITSVDFRVTRDTDLVIQEDEASDLLETIEENLRQRRFGSVVRLSIEAKASDLVKDFLRINLEIDENDIFLVDGPLRLSSLMEIASLDIPELKDPSFVPAVPAGLRGESDPFAAIQRHPILLHHPFDSFHTVIDLVSSASRDPQILAIKQTLYRVGRNSPIVAALMDAVDEGKQVATLVELKARFDEENNIEWARALEDEGVHVVYGLSGLKTHAKLLIIVRKEPEGIRRYMHLGTGNYNATTAHTYTDLGLLTADADIGADVSELFNVLTGYSDQTTYRKLLVAPHGIRRALLAKIEREIAIHQEQGNGHLIFKCNALTDERLIISLYQASRAGVRIDLVIRGICCLRPGIPGVSETIHVRSIVGRFLEHNRVYYFNNGGDEETYLGSADLMERNLDHRIEALFPVEDEHLVRYLRDTLLETYLLDNTHAHILHSDGSYERLIPGDEPPVDAQNTFLEAITRPTTYMDDTDDLT